MLDHTIHELTERAAALLAIVVRSRGVTVPQILHAIALGAAAAAIPLVVIAVFNILNGIALWLAARRIEALAASSQLPQRERLARPFLFAFRHSARLARWAAAELAPTIRDQGKPIGRATDINEAPSAVAPGTPCDAVAIPPYVIGISSRFFTVTIIIGGISLIAAIAIVLFGPRLTAINLGSDVNLQNVLDDGMLVAISAAGIGLAGLASPILLWPISAIGRWNQHRLQRAVKDCVSAAPISASPLVKSKELRTVREILQLRRVLDDERRARIEDSERLAQAIIRMQEISRLWQESNDVDGRGIIQAVRQLALGVAHLHERIEASGSQQAALQISDQDRTSIAALGQTVDRLALLHDDIRNAEFRMGEAVEKLAMVASAIERALECFAAAPAARDAAILEPAVAELNDIMKEAAPG